MKTALVLTGHLRCFEDVFSNTKEKFIDKYKPDIFIHTWDDLGYWTAGPNATKSGVIESSPKLDADKMRRFYKPIEDVVENYYNYDWFFEQRCKRYLPFCEWGQKDNPDIVVRPKNAVSQYFKIHQGVNLMEKYAAISGVRYDLVIRTRADVLWPGEIPEFTPDKFWTVVHRNHRGEGTGDLIFAGSQEMISMFSKMIFYFDDLQKGIGRFCPHLFCQAWIQHLKLPWQEFAAPHEIRHSPCGEYKEWDKR